MLKTFSILCLFVSSVFAAPPKAVPVDPMTLSHEEVIETIRHMDALSKDLSGQLWTANQLNVADAKTIADLQKAKGEVDAWLASAQQAHADALKQVAAQDAALSAEKRGRWWDRIVDWIFGFPIAFALGCIFWAFAWPLLKVTFKIGVKATTGI